MVERERELKEVRAELAEATRKSLLSMEALEALVRELERAKGKPPARPAAGGGAAADAPAERDAPDERDAVPAVGPEAEEVEEPKVQPTPTRRFEPQPAVEPDSDPVPAASNGHSPGAEVFEGCVEVEIGPLGDFAQLVGFEDAAREIGATSDISIVRFSDGRATLEVTLAQPVELLAELERRCAMEFRVRDNRDGRIVLDVDS